MVHCELESEYNSTVRDKEERDLETANAVYDYGFQLLASV